MTLIMTSMNITAKKLPICPTWGHIFAYHVRLWQYALPTTYTQCTVHATLKNITFVTIIKRKYDDGLPDMTLFFSWIKYTPWIYLIQSTMLHRAVKQCSCCCRAAQFLDSTGLQFTADQNSVFPQSVSELHSRGSSTHVCIWQNELLLHPLQAF